MTFSSESKKEIVLGLLLVLFGVVLRLLPHPENFTPLTAIALFAGIALPAAIALIVPVLVMIATDLFIGHHCLFWLTWSTFFLVSLLGVGIGKGKTGWGKVFLGTFAGSLLFFITTNLGVFLFENMYTKDLNGLWTCFVMAIPFFKNSLLGDFFYAAVFFGIFALAKNYLKKYSSTHLKSTA